MRGWRTIILNGLIAAFGVVEAADLTDLVSAQSLPYVLVAIGAVNMILRGLTTTPIFKAEQ